MAQLGAMSPLHHIRGFFYPVKEKPQIAAQLADLGTIEQANPERQPQLTD